MIFQKEKIALFGSVIVKNYNKSPVMVFKHGPINTNLLDYGLNNFPTIFDQNLGGFSPASKFPSPSMQNFLYAYYFYAKNGVKKDGSGDTAIEMENVALRAMAPGGIYDQLGEWFHRYSIDAEWHAPHFEKMLYDNAQLLKNYLDAFLITHNKFFEKVARGKAVQERSWLQRRFTTKAFVQTNSLCRSTVVHCQRDCWQTSSLDT